MPLIKIVSTGGTIANTSGGLVDINDVLRDIPQAGEIADLEITEATRVRSASMRLPQWLEIARAVKDAADNPRIDGIVVTHGTFTVEETAFFLHLTIRTEKPLVMVASQRMHDVLGNDGDRNLVDAIRVASSVDAAGKGTLVVLHEEIHSAREVIKTNQRPGGFVSPAHGIIGHVEKDRVSFYYEPLRRHTSRSEFDIDEIETLPQVDIVAAYVGASDTAAKACVAAGARGLVVNGYAFSGRPSADQRDGLEQIAAAGTPVVLVNRGGAGRIPVDRDDGYLRADTLVAHKARILLMLGLTRTTELGELQRMYNEY